MSSVSSSTKRNEVADQYASQQAEKEKLRAEHEAEIERLHKTYSSEKEHLKDRYETSLQNEKAQTYENLRNTKKQFSSAEKDLKNSGEERIQQKKTELHQEETRIEKEGTFKVNEALKKQAAMEEYQRNQANLADTTARHNLSHNARTIINENNQKIEKLQESKLQELEKRKGEHGVAVGQIREHYDQRQNRLLQQHEKETMNIKKGVDAQINKAALDNAKRLHANLDKQDDPFYRMSYVDSDFTDQGDFYQLSVRLPEYERKGFRVQISGQELQFSGMRNSNVKAEVEPGHDVSTNSFQSFSERYKFDIPVDANAMQVTHDGDWMHYTIPKYGPNHRMREDNMKSKIDRLDLEMSREVEFKDTLPLPKSVRKDTGSGTYS
jgi:HSP20 family molecular chaperone IbpA